MRKAPQYTRRSHSQSPLGMRSYDAAGTNRLIGDWFPANMDFNALIAASSPNMRNRVRDLVRNFPPFKRAVDSVVAFTVGRGSRFQSMATNPDGTPNKAIQHKIENGFRSWMDQADITGKLHFYEVQQLAKRQECETGEFILRYASPRNKNRHPFALQLFESENLTELTYKKQGKDTDIFQGVEFDIYTGEPVAYHFQRAERYLLDSWREKAENVLHCFEVLRPGQLRGVTPFAPAIMLARDMGDYMGAEIDAAKMAAKYLAFVKSGNPEVFQAARGLGNKNASQRDELEYLDNAMIEYLREGEDISFAPPSNRPGDSFDRFTAFVLRMVAITMNLPYEILSGDYQNINYSTSKASRNDFSMFLIPHQFRLENHLVRPVFHKWLEYEALNSDYLKGYFVDPARFRKAIWIPAGMPSVDPLRDGKATIDAIQTGIKSPQMAILAEGRDPEEVVAQRADWIRLCNDHGIDPSTGKASTSMVNNPAKLGATEKLEEEKLEEGSYA